MEIARGGGFSGLSFLPGVISSAVTRRQHLAHLSGRVGWVKAAMEADPGSRKRWGDAVARRASGGVPGHSCQSTSWTPHSHPNTHEPGPEVGGGGSHLAAPECHGVPVRHQGRGWDSVPLQLQVSGTSALPLGHISSQREQGPQRPPGSARRIRPPASQVLRPSPQPDASRRGLWEVRPSQQGPTMGFMPLQDPGCRRPPSGSLSPPCRGRPR